MVWGAKPMRGRDRSGVGKGEGRASALFLSEPDGGDPRITLASTAGINAFTSLLQPDWRISLFLYYALTISTIYIRESCLSLLPCAVLWSVAIYCTDSRRKHDRCVEAARRANEAPRTTPRVLDEAETPCA